MMVPGGSVGGDRRAADKGPDQIEQQALSEDKRQAALSAAANLIGGADKVERLLAWLHGAALSIGSSHQQEVAASSRAKMRERLRDIAAAAQTIGHAIEDAELLGWLDKIGPGPVPNRAYRLIADIARRATEAGFDIRSGGGRDPALPRPEGLSARALCALTVREGQAACGRKKPGARNADAIAAADALWAASTGIVLDRHSGGVEDWRRPWEQAIRASEAMQRHVTLRLRLG